MLTTPTSKPETGSKEATRLDLPRGLGLIQPKRCAPAILVDITSHHCGSQHIQPRLSNRLRCFGRAACALRKRRWAILNAADDAAAVNLLTLLGLNQNDATSVVKQAVSAIPPPRQRHIDAAQVWSSAQKSSSPDFSFSPRNCRLLSASLHYGWDWGWSP